MWRIGGLKRDRGKRRGNDVSIFIISKEKVSFFF